MIEINCKLIWHYWTDDPDCEDEYHSVEVFLNDQKQKEYGDEYHDSSISKIEGWIDCLKILNPDKIVNRIDVNIADIDE